MYGEMILEHVKYALLQDTPVRSAGLWLQLLLEWQNMGNSRAAQPIPQNEDVQVHIACLCLVDLTV